jgi:hypothetical protein
MYKCANIIEVIETFVNGIEVKIKNNRNFFSLLFFKEIEQDFSFTQ